MGESYPRVERGRLYIGFDSCVNACRSSRTQKSNLNQIRRQFPVQNGLSAHWPLERISVRSSGWHSVFIRSSDHKMGLATSILWCARKPSAHSSAVAQNNMTFHSFIMETRHAETRHEACFLWLLFFFFLIQKCHHVKSHEGWSTSTWGKGQLVMTSS